MKTILTKEEFINSYKLKKFADKAIDKYNLKFPIKANKKLAKIVSDLTFDGHLGTKKSMFLFTSGTIIGLKEFEELVRDEFGISGRYKKSNSKWGESYEYRVFSKPICRILKLIGTPDGSKVLTKFSVPKWIYENRLLSREYLKAAFECEGSRWIENNRKRIRFGIQKSKNFKNDVIKFSNQLRIMLDNLGIKTTKVWIVDGNTRKDGVETLSARFGITDSSIEKFERAIGFNKYNR